MNYFEPSLGDLRDAVPSWWGADDPTSEVARYLQTLADQLDGLCAAAEQIGADQALSTASMDALRTEWAVLYGAENEQLPPTVDALRAYLQARAAEDGSTDSLVNTLLSLLRIPANEEGVELVFPADGSGLLFPADGSGLALFESIAERSQLTFPPDGSGLQFPADGSGLTFPQEARVTVIEHPADNYCEVHVKTGLSFDRAAFARACERFRLATDLPTVIVEVT